MLAVTRRAAVDFRPSSSRLRELQQIRTFGASSSSKTDDDDENRKRRNNDPRSIKQDREYCVNLVRERDREGYLCGLLMPKKTRDSFFALRAFNVELASVKDGHNIRKRGTSPPDQLASGNNSVQTTLALQMRMKWWRLAVAKIYRDKEEDTTGQQPSELALSLSTSCWNSPVVRALDRANEQHHFTRRFLERIIDARETDLETNQYMTMNELITYAEDTMSSLLYLTLESNGVRDDEADTVASHAGIGIGLTTTLRATPYRLAHGGEVPLPAELFRHGFPYEQLVPMFLGENNENKITLTESDAKLLHDAVQHVAHTASQHLLEARNLQGQVPSAGRSCLLPVIPTLQYLSKLEQSNYNLFDSTPTTGSERLRLLMLLGRTWMTGVF